jgi:hypothetical protein
MPFATPCVKPAKCVHSELLLLLDKQRAWKKLAREFGDDLATLSMGSARDHAEAGVQAMQAEADKLMTNPAVRLAYEQFLLVCELTKKQVDNA